MKKIIDDTFISMLESRDLCIRGPMSGLFGGNRKTKAYGSSAEFADYRDYVPGDDLRRIDWNLYARFEKIYMKLFVDERQLHHRIYLDASYSMDWGEPNKAQIALKLAAALGFLSVQAMDRVSFHIIHEDVCETLCRTVTGREAFYQAAELLNSVEFYGECDIKKAVCAVEDPGEGDGLSIIISDFLTGSDWKSAVDYLLYHKHEVYLIQILSPDEIAPALNGKVLLIDSESGDEDDIKNYRSEITKASLKAYAEAYRYHQNEIKNFCASRNVGFITLQSDERIEKMLFNKAAEAGLLI